MNSKYYHIVEEHEDPPVEGTEGPRGDPFGYGKRKKEGAYREGVNSVTGIPDGTDPIALERYIDNIYRNLGKTTEKYVEGGARIKRKKKIKVSKKAARHSVSRPIAQHGAKVSDYTNVLMEKMRIIHEQQRLDAAERIRQRNKSRRKG